MFVEVTSYPAAFIGFKLIKVLYILSSFVLGMLKLVPLNCLFDRSYTEVVIIACFSDLSLLDVMI